MSLVDFLVIMAWLGLTLGVGIFAGLRADPETYWVNKRSTGIALLVFTVVSTQVGAGAILGIASATMATGIGFGLVSLVSTVAGFAALAYLAPAVKRFGDRYNAVTLPEVFRVRYGRPVQIAASFVILFTYTSILAAQFLATSGLLAVSTGLDIKTAIFFATVGVIVYSSFAGIRGDIVTDAFHFWAMVVILMGTLLPVLAIKQPASAWLGQIPAEIWSPLTFGGYPFLVVGLLLGVLVPLLGPELWVKIYASRSPQEARRVFFISALTVIPFYLLAVYLGFVGHALYSGKINSDLVVFKLISDFLPMGLKGFGLASILSVVISTANTLIVVIGATAYRDLLQRDPQDKKNIGFGRLITAVAGVVGAVLALTVPNLVQLLLNAYYMLLVLGPALVGVAVWGRSTAHGALWSIITGALATIAFLFIAPRMAFIPGILVSVLAFVLVSFLSRHAATESQDARALLS